MKSEEHNLQVGLVRWFDLVYPHLKRCLFAVPNGGQRHITTARKLKAEGVRSGVSDLILIYDTKTYFIEVKIDKGRQNENQKAFMYAVERQGFDYIIVRGLHDFQKVIKNIIK